LEPSDFRVSRNWFPILNEIRPPLWSATHEGYHRAPQRIEFNSSLRLCDGHILHILQIIWRSREHLCLPPYCIRCHSCEQIQKHIRIPIAPIAIQLSKTQNTTVRIHPHRWHPLRPRQGTFHLRRLIHRITLRQLLPLHPLSPLLPRQKPTSKLEYRSPCPRTQRHNITKTHLRLHAPP
jgi:hypothetical protein